MKYICGSCKYLKKPNYIFTDYEDYRKHIKAENELSSEYKYLKDKKGKVHLSCLTEVLPNHKPCPAHLEL